MSLRTAIQPAWIIARREMLDTLRDWRQMVPTVLLALGFPVLMDFSAQQALEFVAQYGGTVMGDRFIPFLLLMVGFFPVSASLYSALGAFAGEKEGKSLEPLLVTPLADWQLYLGKFVGVIVPPLMAAYLGMSIYSVGLIVLADWRIPASMLVLVYVLATVQAAVMVAVAVVISSQTTSVRAAGMLASFIILPIGGLILAESFVIISSTPEWLWGFVIALLLVAALFVRMGIHLFDREELLIREIDQLDLRKGWRIFRQRLTAGAAGRFGWYRLTLQRVAAWRLPLLLMLGVWAAALLVGYTQAEHFPFPEMLLEDLPAAMSSNLSLLQLGGAGRRPATGAMSLLIVYQNVARTAYSSRAGGLYLWGRGRDGVHAAVGVDRLHSRAIRPGRFKSVGHDPIRAPPRDPRVACSRVGLDSDLSLGRNDGCPASRPGLDRRVDRGSGPFLPNLCRPHTPPTADRLAGRDVSHPQRGGLVLQVDQGPTLPLSPPPRARRLRAGNQTRRGPASAPSPR